MYVLYFSRYSSSPNYWWDLSVSTIAKFLKILKTLQNFFWKKCQQKYPRILIRTQKFRFSHVNHSFHQILTPYKDEIWIPSDSFWNFANFVCIVRKYVSYCLLIENLLKNAYFGYMTIYGHVFVSKNRLVVELSSKDNPHANVSWTWLTIFGTSTNKSDWLITTNSLYGHLHFTLLLRAIRQR